MFYQNSQYPDCEVSHLFVSSNCKVLLPSGSMRQLEQDLSLLKAVLNCLCASMLVDRTYFVGFPAVSTEKVPA